MISEWDILAANTLPDGYTLTDFNTGEAVNVMITNTLSQKQSGFIVSNDFLNDSPPEVRYTLLKAKIAEIVRLLAD